MANHVKHEITPPQKKIQINSCFMKRQHRMGVLRKNLGRYTNCKHCIAVDLIFKHNQKDSKLGRVRYIIYSTNMKPTL